MILQQHHRFVGCVSDQKCVALVMSSVADTFSRQLLNKGSDLTASEHVMSAARTLVDALERIAAKNRADVWAVPEKLAYVQSFPKHILNFMSMCFKDERLFKNFPNVPMS